MSTTTQRKPFIAPVVDIAAQFIKNRGAVTVSELAVYLSAAGVNVRGDDEFAGEELAYFRRGIKEVPALPVIASGSTEFVRTIAALLVNRTVNLDATNPALLKLTWDGRWDAHREASTSMKDKNRTGGHYHILTVRDPGGSQQIAECGEDEGILALRISTSTRCTFATPSMRAGMRSGSPDADRTAAGATRSAISR